MKCIIEYGRQAQRGKEKNKELMEGGRGKQGKKERREKHG